MSTNPTLPQDAVATERAMLDAVRRRLIEIHTGMVDTTSDDREAKAWALAELKAVIRDLTPYRMSRSKAADAG
jgi:hypothetical protein